MLRKQANEMEKTHPKLRRPNRKLCYLTEPQSLPQNWMEPLTLEDVDKIFDDLDPSSSQDAVTVPPSLLHTSDNEANQSEKGDSPVSKDGHVKQKLTGHQKGSKGDLRPPATISPSPKLHTDLDIPLTALGPLKTSSPIVENMVVNHLPELESGDNQVVSPIQLVTEDEGVQKRAQKDLPPEQEPQSHGHTPEKSEDHALKCPPTRFALSKPKKKGAGSCKKSLPVKESTSNKTHTPSNGKGKTQRKDAADPVLSVMKPNPEPTGPKKKPQIVEEQPSEAPPMRVEKDMTCFLQKLREAGQITCARKSLSPVKVLPPTPEPEDDFWILEDETPLRISIPTKLTNRNKQRPRKPSSLDKDSGSDRGAQDSPDETVQKQQGSEQENREATIQTVTKKTQERKGKVKKIEVNEPQSDIPEVSTPEDLPVVDIVKQGKNNKKRQESKKVPSKESDKLKEQPNDCVGTEKENSSLKMEKKALKSSNNRQLKSAKERKEIQTKGKAKSIKVGRKVSLGSDAGKEVENAEKDTERLDSVDGKDNRRQKQLLSDQSLLEGEHLLCKRKRKQTSEWWLSCPSQTSPIVKKSKQNKKETLAEAPSPVEAKKKKILKKKTQTDHSTPLQVSNDAKEKKAKQSRNRNKKEDAADVMKETEVRDIVVSKHLKELEHQEDQDQDLDAAHPASLLDRLHRTCSHSSGDQAFQSGYQNASYENVSITPVPESTRGQRENLEAEKSKRIRKPPGAWWTANDVEESKTKISRQELKTPKERTKKSKPSKRTELGGVGVSLKTQGGAAESHKKVKRAVGSSEGAGQRKRPNVPATSRTSLGKSDGVTSVLSIDAGEDNDLPNHDASGSILDALRCRPVPMIQLPSYEEDEENLTLPSSAVQNALCASDLFAPPLKPLILQPKDKANLNEWCKSLWLGYTDDGPEVTAEHFDWFCYRGRAIGFQVDLNSGTICTGKILLGSWMKKPLWVDHNATSVFNLLTSSVKVTNNGSESRCHPGQSFMVSCGQAYSVENMSAMPAILLFTRIFAECAD